MTIKFKSALTSRPALLTVAIGLSFSAPVRADAPVSVARLVDPIVAHGAPADTPTQQPLAIVKQELPQTAPPAEEAGEAAEAEAPAPVAPALELIGEGMASYYGYELAGNRTANGEIFDPEKMTAAHRSLPMGTRLLVTNLANGRTVEVRINDRGPFAKRRILDLSQGAARKINMIRSGTARVRLELLD